MAFVIYTECYNQNLFLIHYSTIITVKVLIDLKQMSYLTESHGKINQCMPHSLKCPPKPPGKVKPGPTAMLHVPPVPPTKAIPVHTTLHPVSTTGPQIIRLLCIHCTLPILAPTRTTPPLNTVISHHTESITHEAQYIQVKGCIVECILFRLIVI